MLKLHTAVACLLLAPLATAQEAVEAGRTIGTVEIADPAAESLIAADTPIELLATGFEWSEGPAWVNEGGYVIFSDIPRNSVFKWKQGEGLSLYLKPAGYTVALDREGEPGSNGLAIDDRGRLVMCQHGDHAIARMRAATSNPQPEYEVLVDAYEGRALNSPNDLALHSSGAIYFTDPPYGRIGAFNARDRELDFQGVYRWADGEPLKLLTKELKAPNGIAFSPDERRLYVAQSDGDRAIYMVYNVQDDGGIDEGRVLLNVTPMMRQKPGAPDGMAVDKSGNLWATGPGGVLVITPDGKHLATISTGERIANCCFGDDGTTLYMTSDMHLCRVKTKTVGLGF